MLFNYILQSRLKTIRAEIHSPSPEEETCHSTTQNDYLVRKITEPKKDELSAKCTNSDDISPSALDESTLTKRTPTNSVTSSDEPLCCVSSCVPILTDGNGEDGPPYHKAVDREEEWKLKPSTSILSLANIVQNVDKLYEKQEDSYCMTCVVVSTVVFLAGLGMIGAGWLLDKYSDWAVFTELKTMLIIVTPLLGLKGNLGMTLASRLATQSNLGNMNTFKSAVQICASNLFLDQFLSVLAALLVSIVGTVLSFASHGEITYVNVLMITSIACTTASLVSIIQGGFMCATILTAKHCGTNPDNFATSIAGVFGDCVTLVLFAHIGHIIYTNYDNCPWIPYLPLALNVTFVPICGYMASRKKYTRRVMRSGWIAVSAAIIISSCAGLILQQFEAKFDGIALYQPLINGMGGNLVSVLASRVATQLHRDYKIGTMPPYTFCKFWVPPTQVFSGQNDHGRVARFLMVISIVFQSVLGGLLTLMGKPSSVEPFSTFLSLFVAASLFQVMVLIFVARLIINLCWWLKSDPDTNSIPYITALGDLFGTGLLVLVFECKSLLS